MAILTKNRDNLNKKLGIHVIKDHFYQSFDTNTLEDFLSVDNFDTVVFNLSNFIGNSHFGWIDFEAIYNQTGIYKYQFIGELKSFNNLTFQVKNKKDKEIYKKLEFEFIPGEKKYQFVEIYMDWFGKKEGNVVINPPCEGVDYNERKGFWSVYNKDKFKNYSELFKQQEFPFKLDRYNGVITKSIQEYFNSHINQKNSKLLFKDILVPGTLYQFQVDRKKYLFLKGNFERSFYKYVDSKKGVQTLKKEHFKLLMEDIYIWQFS